MGRVAEDLDLNLLPNPSPVSEFNDPSKVQENFETACKNLFGRTATQEEVASLAGAPDGATVQIIVED